MIDVPFLLPHDRRAEIQAAFRWACGLAVAVRLPGAVSLASPGHGPDAGQWLDCAAAAAAPLTAPQSAVGARIEGALEAAGARVRCRVNLGIVLLCAPLAAAAQACDGHGADALHLELEKVLARLDVDDASAMRRTLAASDPGGLGQPGEHGLLWPQGVPPLAALVGASRRERIAQQYVDAFREVFELGLPVFQAALGTVPLSAQVQPGGLPALDPALEHAVQRTYLRWMASGIDSHLARTHGVEAAQRVNVQARGWRMRLPEPYHAPNPVEWANWDDALKARGLVPQTSVDLTIATAFLAALATPDALTP